MQLKRAIVSLAVALVAAASLTGPVAVADPEREDGARAAAPGATDIFKRPRPSADKRACTPRICVHWTTSGKHAPPGKDGNRNKVPDFVEKVRSTVDGIHQAYKKAGYLTPLGDHNIAGDDRTDVYLRNVGERGSRCYTDPPGAVPERTWAYCVLDNNFSHAEFPTGNALANLKVTAAHEYFHAIQMAYDAHADGWLWESTAAWAADQLFPNLTRRLQSLGNSPFSDSLTPLDTYEGQLHGYPAGVGIFWRYLSEHYPLAEGGMPTLVRNVWRRLDTRTAAPGTYSLQALTEVLDERGTNLSTELAAFADANRHPGDPGSYVNGSAYPVADPGVIRTLSASAPGPVGGSKSLDHLTSSTVRFVPHTTLTASTWRLNLAFDLAVLVTRPVAMVTQFRQDGTPMAPRRIALNGAGDGSLVLPFDITTYKYVEVTLVNASDRTGDCGTHDSLPSYSCQGDPLDDNLVASVSGTLTQVPPPPRH
ncbi:hypothetical protein F0U44_00650 [Nocardioides humilatus]|uniref:Uncharacterized protein n=1 Tax=Nocardioides humilatus TaxID=2607660 RepID=A0A5B1LK98_9ACTN|nr:MXAN_6640 family putative metalloprotease [Nocardioides humilatus]KAA1420894.1 hypothetical protein F0U44_00650 [Nocardioides humilatus]